MSALGKVDARGVRPSSWAPNNAGSGSVTVWTKGDDVVRYPAWEECVPRGGAMSGGLWCWVQLECLVPCCTARSTRKPPRDVHARRALLVEHTRSGE